MKSEFDIVKKISRKKKVYHSFGEFEEVYGGWFRFNTLPNTKIAQKIRKKRKKKNNSFI